MRRNELESKLHEMVSSHDQASAKNVGSMMQLIDKYVKQEVIKARLQVMKNLTNHLA